MRNGELPTSLVAAKVSDSDLSRCDCYLTHDSIGRDSAETQDLHSLTNIFGSAVFHDLLAWVDWFVAPRNESSYLSFSDSIVARFEMRNSDFEGAHFGFQNVPILTIEISESSMPNGVDLFMALRKEDDGSERDRLVHYLSIQDSDIRDLNCIGREFGQALNFSGSTFYGLPIFYDVKIPQGCIFPPMSDFLMKEGPEAEKAYRTLRLAMESQRARHEEGMFYALEQDVIQAKKGRFEKIATLGFWYKILSNYGTSYGISLAWIVGSGFVFSIAYALIASPVYGLSYSVNYVSSLACS